MRKLRNRRIPNGTYGGVRGRRADARLLLDVECTETASIWDLLKYYRLPVELSAFSLHYPAETLARHLERRQVPQ